MKKMKKVNLNTTSWLLSHSLAGLIQHVYKCVSSLLHSTKDTGVAVQNMHMLLSFTSVPKQNVCISNVSKNPKGVLSI